MKSPLVALSSSSLGMSLGEINIHNSLSEDEAIYRCKTKDKEYVIVTDFGYELLEEDIKLLAQLAHCPAVKKDGHHAMTNDGKPITCDICRRCYRKTGAITAVYAH